MDDDRQINTLTREQDLLFQAINSIPDPQEKKVFLEKLKKTLENKPRQKDFITNNKFDVSNIFKRLENTSSSHNLCQKKNPFWSYCNVCHFWILIGLKNNFTSSSINTT